MSRGPSLSYDAQETSERLRAILDAAVDGIITIDESGTIETVNPAVVRIFGYERSELIGENVRMLMPEPYHGEHDGYLRRYLETGERRIIGTGREVEGRRKDGTCFPIELSVSEVHAGGRRLFTGIVRDIADRKRIEEELRDSEARYRAIFELSAVGQAELELPSRRYLAVNRRFCEITGFSEEELLQMTVADVTHPDDRAYDQERFDQTLADRQREHFSEKRYLRKDRTIRWVDVRGRLIADDAGNPSRIVEIISDITDRRAAERALRESERQLRQMNETLEMRVAQRTEELVQVNRALSQRNRELRDFANVASHDLREPLRKIQTFADLVEADFAADLGEEGRLYLDRMRRVAVRMTDLLNDLRSFSRITSTADPFMRVDLNMTIDEVLSDLEIRLHDTGGEVVVGTLPAVRGIPTHLRQLFQNLVENALKFHRPGVAPHVEISAEPGDEPALIRLVVQDNGIGFAPAYVERIFAPFQRLHGQARYEGTGMGLAICRRIVEHHGGSIFAQSREGEGARFIIELPSG